MNDSNVNTTIKLNLQTIVKHVILAIFAIFAIFAGLTPQLWRILEDYSSIPMGSKLFSLFYTFNKPSESGVLWWFSKNITLWPPLMLRSTRLLLMDYGKPVSCSSERANTLTRLIALAVLHTWSLSDVIALGSRTHDCLHAKIVAERKTLS